MKALTDLPLKRIRKSLDWDVDFDLGVGCGLKDLRARCTKLVNCLIAYGARHDAIRVVKSTWAGSTP